jgi:hypothetical protein
MVSLKCSNCRKGKPCAMVRMRDGIEYLCGLGRRQLGHRVPQTPPTATA